MRSPRRISRVESLLLSGLLAGLSACSDNLAAPAADPQPSIARERYAPQKELLLVALGKRVFNDQNLSLNRNQACASCHAAAWGFTGPDPEINARGGVMHGSVRSRFGIRKPPSAAYATQSPILFYDSEDGTYVGGNFWDGRATGARLGNPSIEQALAPFVGGPEQALPDQGCVVYRVINGPYAASYHAAWGQSAFQIQFPAGTDQLCGQEGTTLALSPEDRAQTTIEYERVARSIAAFEASPDVNQFSSKYDAYLRGLARLTALELRGLELYEGKANCAACHPNRGERPLFTDFTYDNIGIPANPLNPNYAINPSFVDLGIGGFQNQPSEWGKQKVATLRNLDKRGIPGGAKSYMHNGALKTIAQVVHFYNTRDVLPDCKTVNPRRFGVNCWDAPEVLDNVNRDELGNLGLTPAEEEAVVAYLKTLTDGYVVSPSRP